ncbi:MAG: serine/threonine protein phosphatase [Deltaproteobacteria bacterium]|nr:MAG: serine/threonine protein phosphatase [Deltaproteobacteria bacterium]
MGQGKVKRYFAIGDIHGCLSSLEALLERLNPLLDPEEDAIVFVGDYVDRGPDPRGVIERIIKLREEFPNVICLMGNHEDMLLNWVTKGEDLELYLYNGGGSTIRSYSGGGSFQLPPSHLEFLKSLLLYYETDHYLFVHAGLRPGIPLQRQERFDLLWIRGDFIFSRHDFGKIVVFGHTPLREPLVMDNKIGIDTGAVYGGRLTCVELPALRFYSVPGWEGGLGLV